MRINNKKLNPYIQVMYTFFLISIFCSMMLIFVPVKSITKFIPSYLPLILTTFGTSMFFKFGPKQFDFSSEGEVINIKTKDFFWENYFPRTQKLIDFPKSKLVNFKIKNRIIYKVLELHVKSKRVPHGGFTKIKLNITFLSNHKINDLNKSLTKIIRNNNSTTYEKIELHTNNERAV